MESAETCGTCSKRTTDYTVSITVTTDPDAAFLDHDYIRKAGLTPRRPVTERRTYMCASCEQAGLAVDTMIEKSAAHVDNHLAGATPEYVAPVRQILATLAYRVYQHGVDTVHNGGD